MDLGTPVDHCRPADLGTPMHLDKLVCTCGLGKPVDVSVGTPVDRGTPMDLGTPVDHCRPVDLGTPMHLDNLWTMVHVCTW